LNKETFKSNSFDIDALEQWQFIEEHPEHYFILTIVHNHQIVGSGTLVLEHKFIHGCGLIGHVEGK
jgi:glucosamine-phosphate N-acetyltransferase